MLTLTHTKPDVIVPPLISSQLSKPRAVFGTRGCGLASEGTLLSMGVRDELAVYVLPNATALRVRIEARSCTSRTNWVMRTCLNARRIYRASMDELETGPRRASPLAKHMGPPCRAPAASPTCGGERLRPLARFSEHRKDGCRTQAALSTATHSRCRRRTPLTSLRAIWYRGASAGAQPARRATCQGTNNPSSNYRPAGLVSGSRVAS